MRKSLAMLLSFMIAVGAIAEPVYAMNFENETEVSSSLDESEPDTKDKIVENADAGESIEQDEEQPEESAEPEETIDVGTDSEPEQKIEENDGEVVIPEKKVVEDDGENFGEDSIEGNIGDEASEEETTGEMPEEYESYTSDIPVDLEYFNDVKSAGDALRVKLKEFETSVVIGYQCEENDDIEMIKEQILQEAFRHTGKAEEGDYLRWQCTEYQVTIEKSSEDETSDYVLYFSFVWSENRIDPQDLFDSMDLTDKNDYEKLCSIYDRLRGYAGSTSEYASLLYYLTLSAGIDCRVITGTLDGNAYAWNIVKFGDYYYNVDVTADSLAETKSHFLKSNDSFLDYVRDEEYATEEFENEYPMSDKDYEPSLHNPQISQDTSLKSGQAVNYDCVRFGQYPQNKVTSDMDIYQELEKVNDWDEDDNTELYGQKYHRENGCYFTVEPITWQILLIHEDGTAVLQADRILDAKRYNEDILNNTWYDSSVRTWLNQEFLRNVFTESEKEALNKKDRKIVLVGDSYLDGYSADGHVKSWGEQVAGLLGLNQVSSYHRGGYGFSSRGGFVQLLPNEEDTEVTDVIVMGGWNDHFAPDQIQSGVATFVKKCKIIYPNAEIHIGMVGFDTHSSRFDRWEILKAYEEAAEATGCNYIWGVEDALTEAYMSSDGYHPKEDGQKAIAKALAAYLTDMVSLPTESQLYGTAFAQESGFSSASDIMDEARRRKATDYAQMRGVSVESGQYGSNWWLKSSGKGYTKFVYDMGDVCRVGEEPIHADMGICPVVEVNLNSLDNWEYAGTVSTSVAQDERDNRDFYRKNGIITDELGVQKYYKDGQIDYNANGLILDNSNRYYIKTGLVAVHYTGIVEAADGTSYYVKNGVVESDYTGIAKHTDGQWYYVNRGIIDWNYTSLVFYEGSWYYVQNGKLDWNYSGLVYYYGTWYYVQNGKLNWNYTNLVLYNGSWYYVQNGKINWNYSGLVYYYGTWYYVQNGKLNWNYTNLVSYNGSWYYVQNGKINWNYSGLVCYYGTWYYVQNGKLNWNYNGLVYYYGTWYYVQKGRLNWNYTGLVYHTDKNWYYVQKGKIVWNCTTLVLHTDKNWYYVQNAKINWNYSGLVYYYGTWYYVQNGKLNWNYNGTTTMNGMVYTIRNGRATQIKNSERGR